MAEPTYEQLKAQIEELKAQAKAVRATKGSLECKVSEKGAVSVTGLQRFPVTLYAGQWQKLLADDMVLTILNFIDANHDQLSWKKPEKVKAEPYTEEQKAADWALIHSTPTTPEGVQQKEFATNRFNTMLAKRFSK